MTFIIEQCRSVLVGNVSLWEFLCEFSVSFKTEQILPWKKCFPRSGRFKRCRRPATKVTLPTIRTLRHILRSYSHHVALGFLFHWEFLQVIRQIVQKRHKEAVKVLISTVKDEKKSTLLIVNIKFLVKKQWGHGVRINRNTWVQTYHTINLLSKIFPIVMKM